MRTLYLGTDPSRYVHTGELVHYPVIRTVARKVLDEALLKEALECNHWLFTSPNGVRHWFSLNLLLTYDITLAIGESTAAALRKRGIQARLATVATQEGMIALLETVDLQGARIGWPRSSQARPVLSEYCRKRKIPLLAIDLYEPVAQRLEPVPDLRLFDAIVFTSPSTVDAFLAIFGQIPRDKKIISIGPITAERLLLKLS
jgi:uroporphyrinogen-III synthase